MAYNVFLNTVDTKGKLQSSVAPSAANDLTTKTYVDDAIAAGGGDWLASVKEQLATPPGSPTTGDRYLVAGTGAGGWAGKDNQVAEWDGAWAYTVPTEGAHLFIEGGSGALGGDILAVFNGTTWVKGASLNGALVASNNLSDVANVGTSRTNLGLGSLATENSVNLTSAVSGTLPITNGGTGQTSAALALTALGGAASGANSDITSLTGLTTDLAIAHGGTGAGTAAAAFDALAPMTTPADIIVGGTAGAGGRLGVGTVGQVLTVATGAATLEWAAAGGTGTVTSVGFKDDDGDTYSVTSSGNLTIEGATDSNITSDINTTTGVLSLDMSKSTAALSGATSTIGRAGFSSADFGVTAGFVTIKAAGVDLTAQVTGTLPAGNGGTGLTSIATLLNSAVTKTSLGLVIGTDVQAYDADLAALAGLTAGNSNFIVGNGTTWLSKSNSDARTSLGLGTMATQAASAVAITGGAVTGITDLTIADGGTGASTAPAARTNLGLGTSAVEDVGSADGDILAWGAAAPAANTILATNASGKVISGSVDYVDITGSIANASGYGDFSKPIQLDLSLQEPSGAGYTGGTFSFATSPQILVLDASSAGSNVSTVTLPDPSAASDVGKSFTFKVMGGMSSANKLTVSTGTYTADGASSVVLDQDYQEATFTAIKTSGGAGDRWMIS